VTPYTNMRPNSPPLKVSNIVKCVASTNDCVIKTALQILVDDISNNNIRKN